jgi:hypothetical protein
MRDGPETSLEIARLEFGPCRKKHLLAEPNDVGALVPIDVLQRYPILRIQEHAVVRLIILKLSRKSKSQRNHIESSELQHARTRVRNLESLSHRTVSVNIGRISFKSVSDSQSCIR